MPEVPFAREQSQQSQDEMSLQREQFQVDPLQLEAESSSPTDLVSSMNQNLSANNGNSSSASHSSSIARGMDDPSTLMQSSEITSGVSTLTRRDCGAGGDQFRQNKTNNLLTLPAGSCNMVEEFPISKQQQQHFGVNAYIQSNRPGMMSTTTASSSPAHSESSAELDMLSSTMTPGSHEQAPHSASVDVSGLSSQHHHLSFGQRHGGLPTMDEQEALDAMELERMQNNMSADSGTNIIINYLPPSMTQEEVRALFSRVGEVDSCKLVRDKVTGESLGYAFVNYARAEEASTAIRTLNGLRLQNKFIKVSKARPSSEAIKGANLYISGLPKNMTQPEMERLFQQCGRIITARILHDNKTGISRGVAFIRYDQRCEAEAAIAKFDGFLPPGAIEPMAVKFANTPGNGRTPENLNHLLLRQALQQFNPLSAMTAAATAAVTAAASPAYMATGAFMNPIEQFATLARLKNAMTTTAPPVNDVWSAVTSMNPLVAASSGALTASGWSIFIYNLAPEVDEAAIWQLFGPFGAVQSVKIVRDPNTNKCRGYGFVSMSNYEEALLSIQSLNGFSLNNRILQVSFKTSPTMTTQKVLRSMAYLGMPVTPNHTVQNTSTNLQLQELLNAYLNNPGLFSETGDNSAVAAAVNHLEAQLVQQASQQQQAHNNSLLAAAANVLENELLMNSAVAMVEELKNKQHPFD